MAKTSSSLAGAAHTIASRYATALIETSHDAGALAVVESNLNELAAMMDSSADLTALVSSPVYGRESVTGAVQELARKAGFHQLTINFLGVLAVNGRLNRLPHILEAFAFEVSKRKGEVRAQVRTAFPLSAEQERALQDALKKSVGFKVQLEMSVDREILGGMIVTIGSRMIDDSVKSKLEALRRAMTEKIAA